MGGAVGVVAGAVDGAGLWTTAPMELGVSSGFALIDKRDMDLGELAAALLVHRPQIVHFCGHSQRDGALLFHGIRDEAMAISDEALRQLFAALPERPRLLLLDEPAAGMNYGEAEGLKKQIRWLRDEFKLTVVLVEHNMQVVMGVCEGIHVLDHGETIAGGTPDEVRRDPRTRVISVAYYALVDEARFRAAASGERAVRTGRIRVPWEGETGGPVELVYGRFRVAGTVIEEFVRNYQYPPRSDYCALGSLGEGPIQSVGGVETETPVDGALSVGDASFPTGMQINGNAAEIFTDVTVSVRLGTLEQDIVSGFEQVQQVVDVGQALESSVARAFAGQDDTARAVEQYASALHLDDLALAPSCRASSRCARWPQSRCGCRRVPRSSATAPSTKVAPTPRSAC